MPKRNKADAWKTELKSISGSPRRRHDYHSNQGRRLHGARGARAPTFTNGWAWGHREQNIKQEIAKYFLS